MTTSSDSARVAAAAPHVPSRLPPVALALLLLFALAALLVQLELTVRRPGRGLMSFDSAEYAVAGRELARTGRLATPFALPVMIHALGPAPFPLLVGHPLVPLADAALFRLAGERPVVTLLPPAVAFLAIVWLTALIALSVSGSVGVALAAGMAMALSPPALFFAADGVSELPFAACWTLALLLLMRLPERPRPVALGIALGLAHLARPVLGPLLPVWLAGVWLLLPRPHRGRRLGLFLAAFVPFAAALLAYKRFAAGSALADAGPFLLLTHLQPGFTPHQMPGMMDLPSPLGFLAAHPLALPHKMVVHGARMLAPALQLASPAVTLLFVLHVAAPSGRAGGASPGSWSPCGPGSSCWPRPPRPPRATCSPCTRRCSGSPSRRRPWCAVPAGCRHGWRRRRAWRSRCWSPGTPRCSGGARPARRPPVIAWCSARRSGAP
ncbi:MAG: glycosyltransferase family 39 protein [Candidatus Eisenbacteria bacterium]|nr:glycosyltransferase family 39 protein [Candidatus Eisenbacteria bacterium]